jgi:hypothetical protein
LARRKVSSGVRRFAAISAPASRSSSTSSRIGTSPWRRRRRSTRMRTAELTMASVPTAPNGEARGLRPDAAHRTAQCHERPDDLAGARPGAARRAASGYRSRQASSERATATSEMTESLQHSAVHQ